MKVRYEDMPQGRVIHVAERLDAITATEFERTVFAWVDEGAKKIVLELSELEYISSAGLRSILSISKKLASLGGKIVLCCPQGVVQEVIAVSGFDSFLPIVSSQDEAVGLLG